MQILPSGDRTSDTRNCPVSRWRRTVRQSSILPTPEQSTPHAAGGLSEACCAGAELAAIATINAVVAAAIADGSNRVRLGSDNQLEVRGSSSSLMTDDCLGIHSSTVIYLRTPVLATS